MKPPSNKRLQLRIPVNPEQEGLDKLESEHFAGLKRDFLSQKQLFAYLHRGIAALHLDGGRNVAILGQIGYGRIYYL